MCGIAGKLSFDATFCDEGISWMMDAISHRGPDDYGTIVSRCQRVVFGHRRLSILDLSEAGHQPMVSEDGNTLLVFNGEIYNYRELRERYFHDDRPFHSSGDTELLLRLWEKMGSECISHLRGMFAFAIWDSLEEALFLVRDPCGIKPLYYTCAPGEDGIGFHFCSELKGLQAFPGGLQPDYVSMGLFLKWGSIPAPATPFKGVKALEAGTILKVTRDEVTPTQYWSYGDILARSSENSVDLRSWPEAVEYVRKCLLDTVRSHLVSDVPVGAFLSGGIDSSGVVSLMRALGQKHVGTFCIGFESEDFDESSYAQVVAERFGTDHTNWTLTREDFLGYQERFFDAMDQPSVDGLNTFLVSDLAHRSGYKVVTSGIGGDELFAGYNRDFRKLPKFWHLTQSGGPFLRGLALSAVSAGSALGLLNAQWRRVEAYLSGEPTLSRCLNMGRGLFAPQEVSAAFSDARIGEAAAAVNEESFLPDLSDSLSARDSVSCFLLYRYLGSQLLKDSDTYSMALSLELRTPLVDAKLYEDLARIANKELFYEGEIPKSLFVDAVGDLPKEITHRAKKGFTPPFKAWLLQVNYRSESDFINSEFFDKAVSSFQSGKSHWSRVWSLIVLDRFLARNFG
ncbi:asparagine synthase (glutamine-hydrolyzing) [Coraliomargarita sinensis]|uniref:asparagine synthase (glutamine-hydrolyzing) n=1 Tax=Coraliomargarita sinensis TaxID=2174842 RepID=A0A317ZHG1_9BACT|nr:asparagine synthase (glutamine-hydrolyzing) [Coraliomargarita sinensis]PXA03673.1 asparagine synthase (glutamine-hydrolyzing) [Coraliomargarita sinensis]